VVAELVEALKRPQEKLTKAMASAGSAIRNCQYLKIDFRAIICLAIAEHFKVDLFYFYKP